MLSACSPGEAIIITNDTGSLSSRLFAVFTGQKITSRNGSSAEVQRAPVGNFLRHQQLSLPPGGTGFVGTTLWFCVGALCALPRLQMRTNSRRLCLCFTGGTCHVVLMTSAHVHIGGEPPQGAEYASSRTRAAAFCLGGHDCVFSATSVPHRSEDIRTRKRYKF